MLFEGEIGKPLLIAGYSWLCEERSQEEMKKIVLVCARKH